MLKWKKQQQEKLRDIKIRGSVVKLSGKRRNPYVVRKTAGWRYNKEKDKQVQEYIIINSYLLRI